MTTTKLVDALSEQATRTVRLALLTRIDVVRNLYPIGPVRSCNMQDIAHAARELGLDAIRQIASNLDAIDKAT